LLLFSFAWHSLDSTWNIASSFGNASATSMLLDLSKFSRGPPRWWGGWRAWQTHWVGEMGLFSLEQREGFDGTYDQLANV